MCFWKFLIFKLRLFILTLGGLHNTIKKKKKKKRTTRLWVLAVHLHNNVILGAWKYKLSKTVFQVQVFENNTVIISV